MGLPPSPIGYGLAQPIGLARIAVRTRGDSKRSRRWHLARKPPVIMSNNTACGTLTPILDSISFDQLADIRGGKGSYGDAMKSGAVIGASIGAPAGAALGAWASLMSNFQSSPIPMPTAVATGTAVGGAVGATVGGGIGAGVHFVRNLTHR